MSDTNITQSAFFANVRAALKEQMEQQGHAVPDAVADALAHYISQGDNAEPSRLRAVALAKACDEVAYEIEVDNL